MNQFEILQKIKGVQLTTVTINWASVPPQEVPTTWNSCIHDSPERLKDSFNVEIFHSWKIDSLEDGVEVLKHLLADSDNYKSKEEEANNIIASNIKDLQLEGKDDLHVCLFTMKRR